MKLVKKIAAGLLLTLGLPVLLLTSIELLDTSRSSEEREESLAALFVLGVPFTGLGGWFAWGLYQQAQREKEQEKETESDRLREIFFELVNQQEGKITVLQFAQVAQISGTEARTYLDACAKEFNADFEVSQAGTISYYFQV